MFIFSSLRPLYNFKLQFRTSGLFLYDNTTLHFDEEDLFEYCFETTKNSLCLAYHTDPATCKTSMNLYIKTALNKLYYTCLNSIVSHCDLLCSIF